MINKFLKRAIFLIFAAVFFIAPVFANPLSIYFVIYPTEPVSGTIQICVNVDEFEFIDYVRLKNDSGIQFNMQQVGQHQWCNDINTTLYPDGNYQLRATVQRTIYSEIAHTSWQTITIQNQEDEPFEVQFINLPQSPISGTQIISAETNEQASSVWFNVGIDPAFNGSLFNILGEQIPQTNQHFFNWNTNQILFPDGLYYVKVDATGPAAQDRDTSISSFIVENNPQNFTVNFVNPPSGTISGTHTFCAQAQPSADDVSFRIIGDGVDDNFSSYIGLGLATTYCFDWNTAGYVNGNYSMIATAELSNYADSQHVLNNIEVYNQVDGSIIDDGGTTGGGDGGNTQLIIDVNKPSEYEDRFGKMIVSDIVDFSATTNLSVNSLDFLFYKTLISSSPFLEQSASSQDDINWQLSNFNTEQLPNDKYLVQAMSNGSLSDNSQTIYVENPTYIYFDPQPSEVINYQHYFYVKTTQEVSNVKLHVVQSDSDFEEYYNCVEEDITQDWKCYIDTPLVKDGSYQIKAIVLSSSLETTAETIYHTVLIQNDIPITCQDSDNGQDYFKTGTTSWGPIAGEMHEAIDYCELDGQVLVENYCNYDSQLFVEMSVEQQYNCPNGCLEGACAVGEDTHTIMFNPLPPLENNGQIRFYTHTLQIVPMVQYQISGNTETNLDFELIIEGEQAFIDGLDDQLSWFYFLDSSTVTNGGYQIKAWSLDEQENILAETQIFDFTVNNVEPPVDEPFVPEEPFVDESYKPQINISVTGSTLTPEQKCIKEDIFNIDECQSFIQLSTLPIECQEQNISNIQSCEEYLSQKYVKRECQKNNIIENDLCQNYINEQYLTEIKCQGLEQEECLKIAAEELAGQIVQKQKKFEPIREIMPADDECTVDQPCEAVIPQLGDIKNLSPIVLDDTSEITLTRAYEEIVVTDNKEVFVTAGAIINLDFDQDGIPDEIELRIGTDPKNIDSDGDGFSDREEIISGHNPLGPGEKKIDLEPVEIAIINNEKFEQPKIFGEVKDEFLIEQPQNLEDQVGINLSGVAQPDSVITLFIYSDLPLMVTVKTNKYGNWEYTLQRSLVDGQHVVYSALNDNTGRVVYKSNPLKFFIKEAKAISAQEYVSVGGEETTQKALKIYIIAVAALVFSGFTLFLAYYLQRKKIKEEDEDIAKL